MLNTTQKRILSVLKESKRDKPLSIASISSKLNINSQATIIAEVDILNHGEYVDIERSPSGRMKRVSITEKGHNYFYDGNRIENKQDIQIQLDELKEAVELLNQALNAATVQEKETAMSKLNNLQSVLNGAYNIYENISKFI